MVADTSDDVPDDELAPDELADVAKPLAIGDDPVGNARRRHGALGGVLAAGMFGLDQAIGRKPREEAPIVVDSPTDPIDIDTDGITVPVDHERQVFAPPQPRSDDELPARRRRRHR